METEFTPTPLKREKKKSIFINKLEWPFIFSVRVEDKWEATLDELIWQLDAWKKLKPDKKLQIDIQVNHNGSLYPDTVVFDVFYYEDEPEEQYENRKKAHEHKEYLEFKQRQQDALDKENKERAEYERLKKKYED